MLNNMKANQVTRPAPASHINSQRMVAPKPVVIPVFETAEETEQRVIGMPNATINFNKFNI